MSTFIFSRCTTILFFTNWSNYVLPGGSPNDGVVNVFKFHIVTSEFDPHSCYYVHFQINTSKKGINPLIPRYGINGTSTALLKGWISC